MTFVKMAKNAAELVGETVINIFFSVRFVISFHRFIY